MTFHPDPRLHLFELASLIEDRVSDRKRRLFAVACLARHVHRLSDLRCHRALETARKFANGSIDEAELDRAELDAFEAHADLRDARFNGEAVVPWTWQADLLSRAAVLVVSSGLYFAEDVADYCRRSLGAELETKEEQVQLQLLKEIVGPAELPRFDPHWRVSNDSSVLCLARTIQQDSAFELMPILGDALEEAGCDDASILTHCRETHPHHLGCWLLDLILELA